MADATADAAKVADQTPPKADAGGGGTMLDKVLTALDSLHKRMDDYESSAKAAKADGDQELKGEEAAGENKSATDKKKDSAAPATLGKKADAAKKADWDEDEDKEKKDAKSKADAKRKDEFPPEDEDKDKDKDDAKRKDAAKKSDEFPPKDKDEDKKEDAAVAKGDARADDYVRVKASDWESINQQLSSIHSFVNRPDEERAKFADAQARADAVYGSFGKRAPANLPGEALGDYRKRLATPLRQYSNVWKDEKLSGVPDSVFEKIEDAIYADASRAADNPPDLGEGELRRRDVIDPETRAHRIEWLGNESFIKGLGRPARRVAGFRQRSA